MTDDRVKIYFVYDSVGCIVRGDRRQNLRPTITHCVPRHYIIFWIHSVSLFFIDIKTKSKYCIQHGV